jgi:hypothetical protein
MSRVLVIGLGNPDRGDDAVGLYIAAALAALALPGVTVERAEADGLALPCRALQTPMLALGGHQKSALATGFAGQILLGPHIGDLDGADARTAFAAAATALPALYRLTPARLACEAHPDYASTHHATALGLPTTCVPHHLAHALSGMLDRGLAPPVVAVAWDGAGHGGDGTIHGGEFLAIGADRWRRAAHLLAFRLPGAAAAIRESRRAALGALFAMHGAEALAMDTLPPVAAFPVADRAVLAAMLARGLNAPLTSSAGRLFDAVAAPPLAAGFHAALADAIVATAGRLRINRVLLTGGCFQNARLAGLAAAGLRAAGMQAFCHRSVPPNDGGLWWANSPSPPTPLPRRSADVPRGARRTARHHRRRRTDTLRRRRLRLHRPHHHPGLHPGRAGWRLRAGACRHRHHRAEPRRGSTHPGQPGDAGGRRGIKFVAEFRDPAAARRLAQTIAATVTRPWTLMEICGGQTHSLLRHGIDRMLPESVTLLPGLRHPRRRHRPGHRPRAPARCHPMQLRRHDARTRRSR